MKVPKAFHSQIYNFGIYLIMDNTLELYLPIGDPHRQNDGNFTPNGMLLIVTSNWQSVSK